MHRHSEYPHHSFEHCEGFAPAAPRRAWGLVSVPISGLQLSLPVPIVGLVGYYPANNLIGRSPILRRRSFGHLILPEEGVNLELASVSRGYASPEGRLATCY